MRNFIIQLEGCHSGNCLRINEIELFDKSNAKIPYSVANAFDSLTGGVPQYWAQTGTWGKTGLNDGNKSFGQGTTTVLLFNPSSPTTTPPDTSFARILVTCDVEPAKIALNFTGRDNATGGIPKYVRVLESSILGTKDAGSSIINRAALKNEFIEQSVKNEENNLALVFHKGNYIYYNNGWNSIGPDANELQFSSYGIRDISIIPESAWLTLDGEVELCTYFASPEKSEVSFNIDTDPFSLHDALGDEVDVLYYTDDTSKTSATLAITLNYTPLDELDDMIKIYTWTNDSVPKRISTTVSPKGLTIVQDGDIDLSMIQSKIQIQGSTDVRVAASIDSGTSWKTIIGGVISGINVSDKQAMKDQGTSIMDFNAMTDETWAQLIGSSKKIRFAYYLDSASAYVDSISFTGIATATQSPEIHSIKVSYDERSLEGRLKELERINAVNMAKLNFKANALLQTDKYAMHDMVIDTFETNAMETKSSNLPAIPEKVASNTPVGFSNGFISEIPITSSTLKGITIT